MKKYICTALLITSIFCVAIAPSLTQAAPAVSASGRMEMAKYGELYIGPKTMTVELAATAKDDMALIKVYGINHEWDGRVFLAKATKDNRNRISYVTQVDGQDYTVMITQSDGHNAFYLPKMRDGEMRLSFTRDRSAEVKPEHLMTEFEQKRKK